MKVEGRFGAVQRGFIGEKVTTSGMQLTSRALRFYSHPTTHLVSIRGRFSDYHREMSHQLPKPTSIPTTTMTFTDIG
jgi:hypothetical protein